MSSRSDAERRIDAYKLESDLRDAYVELLSAQFAVDRVKARYTAEEIAAKGSSFMLARSISAASSICEFFASVREYMPPQAGRPPKRKERLPNESPF